MTQQEVMSRMDLAKPFIYRKEFTISGNTASQQIDLVFGSEDFFCTHRVVSAIDTDGIRFDKASEEVQDLFDIEIKDQDGRNFQNDAIELFSLNHRIGNPMLEGWFIQNKSILTLKVSAKDIPDTAKLTFPVTIEVQFHGYNLINK